MKTSRLYSRTGLLAALLAAGLAAGSARAEDEGVVRLGNRSTSSSIQSIDDAQIVARGQSSASQPKSGLLQQLSAHEVAPSCPGDSCCDACCDMCCPDATGGCCAGDRCNGRGLGGLFHSLCGSGKCCSRCTCSNCGGPGCGSGCGCGCGSCGGCGTGFLGLQCAKHNARKQANNAQLNHYLRCKLGYFIPDGCGGVGCKPFGCYSIVYPDNPCYFDGRDGQVYAAQGVGGPVSVPTAPNVRHAYNYGWGIPSSRLTPISNAAY